MSNAAPWSVKGIDPRAREAAREAARRQGLTIGEWLNQAILANEAALAQARGEPPHREEPNASPYRDPPARTLDFRSSDPRTTADREQRLAEALQALAERVDMNDRRNALAMTGVDRTLSAVAGRVERAEKETQADQSRVSDLIDELRDAQSVLLEQMRRIESEDMPAAQAERMNAIESDLHSLSARALMAEAETSQALAKLDGAMTALDSKLAEAASPARVDAQTAALKESFDASLDMMAQDLAAMVAEARADIAGQIVAALGGLQPEEMNQALADVSRRLTAAEKRHTQTIEAVSIEIKRLSESMDRRVRAVEARNDDGGAAELREQMGAMSHAVEHRLSEMETREAAAFSRLGEEVGRIAERLDVRVSQSEANSADAIVKVGEQVALMAERLGAKQDQFATEVAERIVQSEERQTGRLSQALSSISQRLGAIETNTADAISPVAAAMDTFAARLKAIEAQAGVAVTLPDMEPPAAPAYLDAPVTHAEPEATPTLRKAPFALEHEDDLHARYAPEPETAPASEPLELADLPVARETVYLEDIEEEFEQRDQDPAFAPSFELPPSQAPKNLDDPFADIVDSPPEDDEDDLFWSTGKPTGGADIDHTITDASEEEEPAQSGAADPFALADDDLDEFDARDTVLGASEDDRALTAEKDIERAMFGAGLDLDGAAPKEDYLTAARRAAQANGGAAPVRARAAEKAEPSTALRGLTRVVLWGAAGALAAALAGGVYVYSTQAKQQGDFPIDPQKDAALAPPGSIAEGAALAAAEGDAQTAGEDAVPLDDVAPAPARAGPLDVPLATPQAANIPGRPLALPVSAGGAMALTTLEDAAVRGDAVAQYDLALDRIAAGDMQRGVASLRRAAGQGLAMAQYRLAKLYERGDGVALDLSEARRWTERAAVAGNRKAMHDLGVYYARGEGAPFDEGQAFKWFRQAAEYGVADSQFNLGVLYAQGRGVAADPLEALYWFTIAASGGDSDARARAGLIEEKLSAGQIAATRARADAFHAKPGVPRANGEFGPRAWAPSAALEAANASTPRT